MKVRWHEEEWTSTPPFPFVFQETKTSVVVGLIDLLFISYVDYERD